MLDRSIPPTNKKISFDGLPKIETLVLNSRVQLHYLHSSEQPVIKLELVFLSGSWYESKKGVAWFTAKMLTKGTQKKSSKQIMEGFEALGAFLQIEADFDHVNISVYGLSKNFSAVLYLLDELLHESTLPTKELEVLKSNRADQIRLNDDKADMYATKMLRHLIYGGDYPYGKILDAEDIQAVLAKDISTYYNQCLLGNAQVFLSGYIDDKLIRDINDILGLTYYSVGEIKRNQPNRPKENLYIEKQGSLQSSVRLAWTIPTKSDSDYFSYLITNNLLGGYFGSRLMKNIREEKGFTYGINSVPIHFQYSSFGIIATDVKAAHTQETYDEIYKEITRLKTELVSADELKILTNYMSGTFLSSLNTSFNTMEQFKVQIMYKLGNTYFIDFFEALNNVDAYEIQLMAHKYFDIDQAYSVTVGSNT